MHRAYRLSEKQDARLENEALEEANAKESRSGSRISNISSLDNGTMVEALKYLSYCQLAKNALVSKRFRNVIETHRHKLAFLYVDTIRMGCFYSSGPATIKIFNKELSPDEYNGWVVRNNYSKQITPERQAAGDGQDYELCAYGDYKDPNNKGSSVFFSRVKEINHETLFEHFIRLLTDPFVSIRDMKLTPQTDTFNLLTAAIDRINRGRLQCEKLEFYFESLNWTKDRVRCDIFQIIIPNSSANRDKQLLDFFATGSHCTSKIDAIGSHISKAVIIDFVQKFTDLKNCDGNQLIKSVKGDVSAQTSEAFKNNYAKFLVKEEKAEIVCIIIITHIFEFVNAVIGKNCSSPSHLVFSQLKSH